ncbi:MAG TPA: alpha-galactosidase [Actinomycetales bacterium]|nr:alpha-galactosidase [Actinomycetales bacterium]
MATNEPDRRLVVLSNAGVSLLIDVGAGIPRVLHWGERIESVADDVSFMGTLAHSQHGADGLSGSRRIPSVVPEQSDGWFGTPGLEGHREGRAFTSRFRGDGWELSGQPGATQRLVCRAVDKTAELALTTTVELFAPGVVRLQALLENLDPEDPYTLNSLLLALPVPIEAQELLDFTGRHLRERTPQRRPLTAGTHLREGRRGRTGSDAAFVLLAGSPGFGPRKGEVWGVHTAWSGNHATFAELALTGIRVLGGGEVLMPGEVILGPGETYTSPWLYGAYGHGLDQISQGFHRYLRQRASHPSSTRPVVLNTWEAVYFDHRLATLTELASLGAKVGVERFVLDDGWFRGRRDDHAGLGDWQVDPTVWPEGLGPLVTAVRDLGMQFGLWFEPEMVNDDSDLARTHPEWILGAGERLPLSGRHQHVLNLAIPEAYAYLLESISAVIAEHRIDYVKWDHNRDLLEAGDRRTGQARVHRQTQAVYALMDELRRRFPYLEIESCSSGGGRIDLEILQRTDRVWASDCIDALERQRIQRWTSLLLPPELIGSHVGAPTAHTTGRTHSLAFRAATALFAHFGIEWDLRTASPSELEELGEWVAFYKEERDLLHSGTKVDCDYPEDTLWAYGVVSEDRQRALFSFTAMDTAAAAQPGRIRLPGLDPRLRYRIEPVRLSDPALVRTRSGPPSWWHVETTVTGQLLGSVGLQAPMLYPEQSLLLRLFAQPIPKSR